MKTEKYIIETAIDNCAGIEGSAEELKSSLSHSGKGKGQLLIVYPGLLADQEFRLLVLFYSHFIIFRCGFASVFDIGWIIRAV